jgi:hypothetical protein
MNEGGKMAQSNEKGDERGNPGLMSERALISDRALERARWWGGPPDGRGDSAQRLNDAAGLLRNAVKRLREAAQRLDAAARGLNELAGWLDNVAGGPRNEA